MVNQTCRLSVVGQGELATNSIMRDRLDAVGFAVDRDRAREGEIRAVANQRLFVIVGGENCH